MFNQLQKHQSRIIAGVQNIGALSKQPRRMLIFRHAHRHNNMALRRNEADAESNREYILNICILSREKGPHLMKNQCQSLV